MTSWVELARDTIARVHQGLPEDATLAERQAAVDAAYPFGERAYWPYRGWLKARKAYLRRFGYLSRGERPADAPLFPELQRDPITGRPIIP
jgi:hypothetical protein